MVAPARKRRLKCPSPHLFRSLAYLPRISTTPGQPAHRTTGMPHRTSPKIGFVFQEYTPSKCFCLGFPARPRAAGVRKSHRRCRISCLDPPAKVRQIGFVSSSPPVGSHVINLWWQGFYVHLGTCQIGFVFSHCPPDPSTSLRTARRWRTDWLCFFKKADPYEARQPQPRINTRKRVNAGNISPLPFRMTMGYILPPILHSQEAIC